MPRSVKKGPYIADHLLKKLEKIKRTGQKQPIKTWSRQSTITPDFVGYSVAVHDGRKHIPIFITENMVGYKFGFFVPTRVFRKHGGVKSKKASAKT